MYANPPPQYYANFENGGQYPAAKYKRKSGGSSCCRCICCCCCFFFLLIFIMFIVMFTMYRIYDPRFPDYNVEDLQVKAFDIQPDFSLNTELELSVRSENPNKRIGFIYGSDNWIDVTFKDVSICGGKVPAFYQGHENTTVINVDLKGRSIFNSGLRKDLNESIRNHWIPLLVKLRVPVSITLGETPLREIKAFVNCSLVLDNLAPNSTAEIKSKDISVHFEL